MTKLYLVTRADLPPGQQAVQAAHALREFVNDWPDEDRDWYATSKTLVLLTVPDEAALGNLMATAFRQRIPAARFFEPDRNDEMTAIAIAPSGAWLCQNLPLALQQAPVA